MLMAKNSNGKLVNAIDEKKEDNYDYVCPYCGNKVILKKGNIKIHHFVHKPDSECYFNHEGESLIHERMKWNIKKIIEKDNKYLKKSELEYRIGNRIADYYFETRGGYKVAVEAVHKNENINDFITKNQDYYNNGVYVLWFFNHDNFRNKDEMRIHEIWRLASKMYYGKIFCMDHYDGIMYAVRLNKAKRLSKYGNPYWLKGTVVPLFKRLLNFKVSSFQKRKRDKWLDFDRCVASPFVRTFWKNDYTEKFIYDGVLYNI